MALLTRLKAVRALGFGNVARVIAYRLRLRARLHPVQRLPRPAIAAGPFYRPPEVRTVPARSQAWRHSANYFGWLRPPLGDGPPDWHRNVLTGCSAASADADWWTIADFDPSTGDIKAVWEASRFDWVVSLAQQAAAGEPGATARLNNWLADWTKRNPPWRGHNWKCAQEASIRTMHLAVAALIQDQLAHAEPALLDLIEMHLTRIAPTTAYAAAQDNNHGTSEGAALFIGGSWLARCGRRAGKAWSAQGRRFLEDRVGRLVASDGSFSQYSVTYHRLMLDTLSLTELWRRRLELPAFSPFFCTRAAAGADWLRAMTNSQSGDAPNLGANDSTNLLPLTGAGNRDFRPSVQLATALFSNRVAYGAPGAHRDQLAWLGVAEPGAAALAPPGQFDDGGYLWLQAGVARALLRYARFRFRPSHADVLHVDLWVGADNVMRDGGSYSYAAEPAIQQEFAGARGHNAIMFDDHDQMPRLGRFLWGEWLTTVSLEPARAGDGQATAAAGYRDAWGAEHHRALELAERQLTVTDRVAGFGRRAVLRWRLRPGEWIVEGENVRCGDVSLEVRADIPIVRCELVSGWESREYLQKTPLPVLEVEIARPGTLTTVVRWPA